MAKISKALYRPQLLGGIERIYAVILGALFLIILFFGDFWGRIIGITLIFLVWFLMATANRADYIFFKVLIRHLRQSNAYLAHSKPCRVIKTKVTIKE